MVNSLSDNQMLFYAGLFPSPSSISPTPLPTKKALRICANPMTQLGRGGWVCAHPRPPVATLLITILKITVYAVCLLNAGFQQSQPHYIWLDTYIYTVLLREGRPISYTLYVHVKLTAKLQNRKAYITPISSYSRSLKPSSICGPLGNK